jgi:hypothetical protein
VAVVQITEHLQPGQLERELAKVEDRRDPPVPVAAWLLLDGRAWDALLLGWATNPNGGNDGLRGLVLLHREYAPGFGQELLTWVRAEEMEPR